MTHTQKIRDILEKRGQISNFHAIERRLSLRLGARIFNLRAEGWKIETRKKKNKDTVYVLISKPKRRARR
jgi:hypothetical protein